MSVFGNCEGKKYCYTKNNYRFVVMFSIEMQIHTADYYNKPRFPSTLIHFSIGFFLKNNIRNYISKPRINVLYIF